MVLKTLLDTKMVKLLNHYVLFYLRWVDLLNILKTTKKNMSFLADDEDVILKYNKIVKYIKTRLKTFEDKVITKFTNNEIPKENNHYCSNLCWFCNKVRKKHYPQVNLGQCKFRLKKKKDIDLFDNKLKDSSDESEIEAEWI